MITGLDVITDAPPGWIGLVCADDAMAIWLLRAILVENVAVRREGSVLYLPAAPDYRARGRDQERRDRRRQDPSLLDGARHGSLEPYK